MCTLISDINSSPFLMSFYKIVSLFTYVQIISQSLFPSYISFWETSKCSNFASILAFFARIVPEGYSENFLQITIICIFFCMIIFSIICLWFFFSYSNPLFRHIHSPSLFMIQVGISKLLLIPSFSLLFHECNYFANVPSTPEFILSVISVFCCLILSYFFTVIGNVIPCFSGSGNLSWITKDFIFEIGYIMIIILQSEFFSTIQIRTIRIIVLLCSFFFYLSITIFDFATNITSRIFFFFTDITNLSLLITSTLFLIREFYPIDSGSFLLYYIFTLVLSYSIIVFAHEIYQNFIVKIAQNYLCDRDYEKILKFPRRVIMLILCAIYPSIGNDWEYFDLIISHFSHDYQFLFLYAKFLVLHPNEKQRIRKVIKDMKKIQGLDFVFSLRTRFIQLLLIQFDLNNELSITSRSKFSKNEVINYFSSLRMFWTEVLLAKPNKLVTLTVNASNYFLDVVHKYAMNGIDYDQFKQLKEVCSINKSRLLNEKSKTPMKIISENRFFNTNQVINKLKEAENQIPNTSIGMFESKNVSDSILKWQHLSFYIPFYFAFFAIFFFGTYQFFSNSHFWHYFNLFRSVINITNYFSGTEGMIPYITSVESKIVNSSGIVKYIIHDDFYRSSLLDPRQDAIHNVEITYSLFDELKESLLSFFNLSVINSLSKAQVCKEQIGHSLHSLSFIPCMEVTRVKIENLINLNSDELQKIMVSEDSKTIFNSTLNLLSFMSSYTFNMTDWIPPLLDEREVRISKSMITIVYIVAFFSFIMSLISIFFLMRGYNRFFNILISIPKNEISNLISKIGVTNSNVSDYHIQERYNINLLSYKSPPSSFHSNISISIFLVVVDFLLILSAAIFINPLKNSLLSCIRGAFINMNEMKLETIVVPYCFKMYYSLNEVVYLYETNQTDNENYEYFLNILKETADEAYATINPYMSNFQPRIIKNFYQKSLVNGYTIQNTFQIMSMILYDFYSDLKHGKNPSHLNLVIGSVFRFMDNAIPRLLDEANDALIKMKLYNNKMKALRIFIYLSALVIVFVIVDVILRPFKNGSVLFSVPLSTITLSEPEFKPSILTENDPLDSEAIFPKLGHYLLLVDKNNMIIKATEDTMLFFDIEPNTITIDELVSRIEKYPTDHVFPPKEIDQVDELLDQQQQQQFEQQHQQPYIEFNVNEPATVSIDIDSCVPSVDSANGQDVFLRFWFFKTDLCDSTYAVVIDDITIFSTQVSLVNEEANKVRMLIYQIVPWPVAMNILSNDEYTPICHGSLAIATFFIENANLDENMRIHKYLTEGLSAYPNLTYFGRSVTFFRIATPVFDFDYSVPEHTENLIHFSYDFVKKIKTDATVYSQPTIRKIAPSQQSISNINASCSICNIGSVGSLNLPNNNNNNNNNNFDENYAQKDFCRPNNSIENFPPFQNVLNNDSLGHIRRNGSSSTVSSSTNKRGNISKSNSCDINTSMGKASMLIEKKEQLSVRCSIDINGPYDSILPDIPNLPPYFSIYGKIEDIGLFISMNSRPNRVNVSQSVYESLYGIFNFDFENEVFTLNGKSVLVYTLADYPDTK